MQDRLPDSCQALQLSYPRATAGGERGGAGRKATALVGLTAIRMAMPALLVRNTPPQRLGWIFAVQQGVGALASLALPVVLVALPGAVREKLAQELTDGLGAVKAVGHELMETGHRAAARGDQAMAQACAAQLGRLGQSLSQPQYTPMAQLVGKALVKMGAAPSPR